MLTFTRSLCFAFLLAASAHSQSTGGSAPAFPGAGIRPGGPRPGDLLAKPGGGAFVLDPHRNGQAPALHLEETRVGRLVDVHGLAAGGAVDPEPVLRDFLVGETVQSDGADYSLFSSPSTHKWRLVVQRVPGAPEPSPGAGTFTDLVRRAEDLTIELEPRAPFAGLVQAVPRNGALALRFDDLLDDDDTAQLLQDVRVAVGMPPSVPFGARVRFDEHHGGLAQGAFHATRVQIDFTVSEFEAEEHPVALFIHPLGVPAGEGTAANVLVRLPTQTDPGSGQFTRLTNRAGRPLSVTGNGPVDLFSPTRDVVRAARGADTDQPTNGFLLDLEPPRLVGGFGVDVVAAVPDPTGDAGFAFVVDYLAPPTCAARPRVLDALEIGGRTLEVIADGPAPAAGGLVQGVHVRIAQRAPAAAGTLLGSALLLAPLRAGSGASACWFTILPAPSAPPGAGVSTTAQFLSRYSEPLDPGSLDPYDTFRLVAGPLGTPADAGNTVVAELLPGPELAALALSPLLPLAHAQGAATPYGIEVLAGPEGPRDLAGNPLVAGAAAEIRIDPTEASETSGGIVLRFSSTNEVPGPGADLRGAFFFDLDEGTIRGRPRAFFSVPVDRTNPVPSIMIPFPPGIRTPLNPLGAKLHAVWRYADLGWHAFDETKYDVDVAGLAWSPIGGLVVSDFYPQFEIRLAHGRRLPDEDIDPFLLPRWPASGLVGRNGLYADNILEDPLSPQKVVHPRTLGYGVDAADLFMSHTGTPLMPYPMNQGGGPLSTYTWRDTAVLAEGGPSGAGVPMGVEVGPPLFLEPATGTLAPANQVPSVGLPLLLEYRCYPTDTGLGLNALDISLAINSSALPAFRSFSAGGVNTLGQVVVKNPDLELSPSGGFNAFSNPPGQPTLRANDNASYIGQIDLVYRISRAHSAWLDTGSATADHVAALASVVPAAPSAAEVEVALRGATGFSGTNGSETDAAQLDAYGDLETGSALFLGGDATWKADPDDIDGARFVQVRFTFVNDLASGATPALDAFALAFQR